MVCYIDTIIFQLFVSLNATENDSQWVNYQGCILWISKTPIWNSVTPRPTESIHYMKFFASNRTTLSPRAGLFKAFWSSFATFWCGFLISFSFSLSLNNLKLLKQTVKTFVDKRLILGLTFNPGLELSGFWTT